MGNEHTVDYYPSSSKLHPLNFLWTPKTLYLSSIFLEIFLKLVYISHQPWFRKTGPSMKGPGLQELEFWYTFFRAPNNMFAYTIVHLTFRAPQLVVRVACRAPTTKIEIF